MERRIFIAVILGALVMYGWQALFLPPPPAPTPATTATGAPAATQPAPASPSAPAPAPSTAAPTAPAAPPVVAVKGESSEREITVETAVAEIVLTNRGARVLHWRLKDYQDPSGQRVDLIPSNSPADQPRPFALRVDDPQLTGRLNESLYQVSGDSSGRIDARTSAATVVFEFEDAAGLRAQGVPLRAAACRRVHRRHPQRRGDDQPDHRVGTWPRRPRRRVVGRQLLHRKRGATACGRVSPRWRRRAPPGGRGLVAAGARRTVPLCRHRRPLLPRGSHQSRPGAAPIPLGPASGCRTRCADSVPVRGLHTATAAARAEAVRRAQTVRCTPRRRR